jgi:hypothetical protein
MVLPHAQVFARRRIPLFSGIDTSFAQISAADDAVDSPRRRSGHEDALMTMMSTLRGAQYEF